MIKAPRLRSSKTQFKRAAAAALPSPLASRLFPGLSALWFAALFGLGSLVASGEALAGLVLHLHLAAILPAAAPPLGMTARLLLGLAFAALGGIVGLAIGVVFYLRAGGKLPARPIRAAAAPAPAEEPAVSPARFQRVRSRDAHPDAPPRRPLVVTEDVLPYPTSMVDTDAARPLFMPAPVEDADAPEPADLPPFLAAAAFAVHNDEAPVLIAPFEPIIEPAAVEPEPVPVESIAVEAIIELTQAAAPAPAVNPPPLASLAASAPNLALTDLPLASLGLVQLIERLAQAIATRQAHRAAAAAATAEAAFTFEPVDLRQPLHRFDPMTMDPAGPLLRAKKARSDAFDADDSNLDGARHGASLHDPLTGITAWDDDHAEPLAPARFLGGAIAAIAPTGLPGAERDGTVVDQRYSSLADMALARPELVPFDATQDHVPDVAVGEDAGAPDPVIPFRSRLAAGDPHAGNDPDRALREALATLRQMSAQR